MISAAAKLVERVLGWQAIFSLGTGALVALAAPSLLLVTDPIATSMTRSLLALAALGSVVALLLSWLRLRRHRFTLRALALGSRSLEPGHLSELSREPWRSTRDWTLPIVLALTALATPLRPPLMDLSTGASAALLGAVMFAAASLPLHVLIRAIITRALELAPPEVMAEVLEEARHTELPRRPVPRRLMAALTTPVLFLAIGSALIANAHIRRADERNREETARALARTALEDSPGVVPEAGRAEAIEAAEKLGFTGSASPEPGGYRLVRREKGVVQLSTPLDSGSARVSFDGSTVPVISFNALLITLLAVALAVAGGALLGRNLLRDSRMATRGLSLLGTEAVLSGAAQVMDQPRFDVVRQLGTAIEGLAERFRVFAQAQERAIKAREAAARMRGLFFASVSHDLKSPLNAVLGFTELVRLEPLTAEQEESLDLIDRRGRELLGLIETILDAARVEAQQLQLLREPVAVRELLESARDKGRQLAADSRQDVVLAIESDLPALSADRLRLGRALAALIGHALRSQGQRPGVLQIRARRASGDVHARIEVPVSSKTHDTAQLEAMLNPDGVHGTREHRGLALALGLAHAVVRLHGGAITVEHDGRGEGHLFVVSVPFVSHASTQSEPG